MPHVRLVQELVSQCDSRVSGLDPFPQYQGRLKANKKFVMRFPLNRWLSLFGQQHYGTQPHLLLLPTTQKLPTELERMDLGVDLLLHKDTKHNGHQTCVRPALMSIPYPGTDSAMTAQ